jgi:hypothetical protein
MRKILILAVGFAAIAGVQPTLADQAAQVCVNKALRQCNAPGSGCTTSTQYLALFNQCVSNAPAAAAKKQQENRNLIASERNSLNSQKKSRQ